MFTLAIKKRNLKDDVASLRKTGHIPAVFYGKKEESTPITVSTAEFVKVFKHAGESSVISLKGDGLEVEALIHELDLHPVTGKVRHADFYVFEKGKKLKVNIPLEFVGVAPAIKELHGTLVKVMHELEVEALPKDLPQKIEVDISPLVDFKSVIHAKDLKLPAGVALAANAEEIVASVYEPKEEVEAAPVDLSAIEVEKKGKEAKEGAEGAEAPAAAEPAKKAEPKK